MKMKKYQKPVYSKVFKQVIGITHREDGPAIIHSNGDKEWYYEGESHRLDGPAVECIDGTKEWWISGKRIDCSTQEEFERLIKIKLFW